jgi:hypothetical protein
MNLLPWSQDFTNVNWSKLNITVTANTTTAPDLSNTANSIIPNTINGDHDFTENAGTVNSANTYTISVYVKSNGYNFVRLSFEGAASNVNYTFFNLSNGIIGNTSSMLSNTITNVGNGWYRCSSTRTTDFSGILKMAIYVTSANGQFSYTGDGVSGLYLWGTQLELGSVSTTYIPTTTTAVSRTPTWTDLSRGGNNGTLTNGPTYNYSNGGGIVLTNTLNATGSSVTQRVVVPNTPSIQFTTGMSADIWFYANGSTQPSTLPRLLEKGDFYVLIFQTLPSNLNFNVSSVAGNRTIGTSNSPITNTTRINVTTTYDGQISKIYINGVLNNTTDWGSVSLISPTSTDLSIGDNFGWVRTFNGTIYNTKLYNRALSASEVLQNYNTTKSRFGL